MNETVEGHGSARTAITTFALSSLGDLARQAEADEEHLLGGERLDGRRKTRRS
jgi:hypothetical protein